MAATGILLRRDTKANLIADPPLTGEMVFATDTGEHGWYDETSTLIWAKINEGAGGGSTAIETITYYSYDNLNAYEGNVVFTQADHTQTCELDVTIQVKAKFAKSTNYITETSNIKIVVPPQEIEGASFHVHLRRMRLPAPVIAGVTGDSGYNEDWIDIGIVANYLDVGALRITWEFNQGWPVELNATKAIVSLTNIEPDKLIPAL